MSQERPPLEEMTLRQLRRVASECGISRYSRMRKSQLLSAIQAVLPEKINPTTASPTTTSPKTASLSSPSRQLEAQEEVEAAKFELGQDDRTGGELASVDEGLADLPEGYGESRIVLMPRDPQWAYCYWDITNEQKEELRRQGGQQLALRVYDATDIDLNYQPPHSIQEYPCDELAREWYLPIPVSDRDYAVEIGYRCADGRWLVLARSLTVHTPPVYPSDWIEDIFVTVNWDEPLVGKTVATLVPPSKKNGSQRSGRAQSPLRRNLRDGQIRRSTTGGRFYLWVDAPSPRTSGQFLCLPLWCGNVGCSYHVRFDHVRRGHVRCGHGGLNAADSSSPILVGG